MEKSKNIQWDFGDGRVFDVFGQVRITAKKVQEDSRTHNKAQIQSLIEKKGYASLYSYDPRIERIPEVCFAAKNKNGKVVSFHGKNFLPVRYGGSIAELIVSVKNCPVGVEPKLFQFYARDETLESSESGNMHLTQKNSEWRILKDCFGEDCLEFRFVFLKQSQLSRPDHTVFRFFCLVDLREKKQLQLEEDLNEEPSITMDIDRPSPEPTKRRKSDNQLKDQLHPSSLAFASEFWDEMMDFDFHSDSQSGGGDEVTIAGCPLSPPPQTIDQDPDLLEQKHHLLEQKQHKLLEQIPQLQEPTKRRKIEFNEEKELKPEEEEEKEEEEETEEEEEEEEEEEIDFEREIEELSPLFRVAQKGLEESLYVLLENQQNVHVDVSMTNGVTPLFLCAENGHLSIVKALLEKGANVNAQKTTGATPLFIAAQKGHKEVVEILLNEKNANVNEGTSSLFIAVQNGHESIVQLLLEKGAKVNIQMENGATPLFIGAQFGRQKIVQKLLEFGAEADVNVPDLEDKATPLFVAINGQYIQIVRDLLENKADVNLPMRDGIVPLHTAVQTGNEEIVKLLLEKGASVNATRKDGATPLYIATFMKHQNIVQILLDHGAKVNLARNSGATPLFIAAQNGDEQILDLLLKKGATVEAEKTNGATPLFIASENGHNHIVQHLLKKGAIINHQKEDESTALHSAVMNKHRKVVQTLLEKGANPNLKIEKKITPLFIAAENGDEQIVQCLLKHDAEVDPKVQDVTTPLFVAAQKGFEKVVQSLLEYSADINVSKNGKSPLYVAAENGHQQVVQLLLEKNALVADSSSSSQKEKEEALKSALFIAAQKGNETIVRIFRKREEEEKERRKEEEKLREELKERSFEELFQDCLFKKEFKRAQILLEMKDIINSFSMLSRKFTLLHHAAAENGSEQIIKILLEKGANVNASNVVIFHSFKKKDHLFHNELGKTPLHVAAENGSEQTVKILLEQGANIEASNKMGMTPLHVAAKNGSEQTVKILLEQGANIEASNKVEKTPLHFAAENGFPEIVKILLERGANIEASNKWGKTPFYYAEENGFQEIVQMLKTEEEEAPPQSKKRKMSQFGTFVSKIGDDLQKKTEKLNTSPSKTKKDDKLNTSHSFSGGKRPRLVQPLHSPTAQNAIVLYKPLADVPGTKVAVVVDPLLGSKLRPHQIEGVQFMFDCLTGLNGKKMNGTGCILADELGLGKSLQAITLLWTLLKQGPEGEPVAEAALIICPSSLVQNWVCELKKWLGEAIRPVAIADSEGNPKKKLALFEGDHDVLIISYEQLKIHCNEIYKMKTIGLLIADEGHCLKNARMKTTQAAAAVPAKRRVILSGIPIQNDLKEFYSLVSFVNPHVFGNETKFRNVFEEPVRKSRDPGASKEEKNEGLARMRHLTQIASQLVLRRTFKTTMNYLPPKTECTLFCRLTDLQRELYESLLTERKEMVLQKNAESGRGKSPALSLLTTLKKLCNSPDLLLEMTFRKPDSLPPGVLERLKKMKPKKNIECHTEYSGKVSFTKTLLLEIFKESPDRAVIVSMYKETLEVLAVLCRQNGIKYLQLDGETSIKKRQVLVDQLNDPNGQERVMLLSSRVGGVGLNLIGANHLILFDGSWNPADDAQAMARIWRPGQQKECFIYRLLCTGTVEEKIYQRQLTKSTLSTRNVEQQKGDDGSNFSTSELKDLFSLQKETICETHDLLGCQCSKSIRTFGMGRVSVDELMYWEHVSDITKSTNSALALAGEGIVTFMFSKRMDTKQASVDQDQQVQKDEVFFDDLKGEEG